VNHVVLLRCLHEHLFQARLLPCVDESRRANFQQASSSSEKPPGLAGGARASARFNVATQLILAGNIHSERNAKARRGRNQSQLNKEGRKSGMPLSVPGFLVSLCKSSQDSTMS